MSFPRYPKYKQSGVEWLGEVPEHWEISRFKHHLERNDGGVWGEEPVGIGDTVVLRSTEQTIDGQWQIDEPASRQLSEVEINAALLVEGDLLLTKSSGSSMHIGKTTLVDTVVAAMKCCYSNFMQRLRLQSSCEPKFVWFLLNNRISRLQFDLLSNSTTGLANLNGTVIGQLVMPAPPLAEQHAIASFLDRETAKIDALIAEQQRLIELLQEKRQAVISHAVTKGLNPDAPMKDSGIEWLGEVPEHWEVGPVKHFFTSLDGRRIPLSTEERSHRQGEFPYYGASGIIDYVDDFLFDENLVLVSEDGANLVNRATPIAFVATGKYWVNNHAHILKPNDGNLNYWAERIEAVDLAPFVSGSAQPKFTAEALMNLRIAVPPTAEERASIQKYFLNSICGVDALINEAKRATSLLQERRSALISAAVTGQIDVRGLAPKEAA